MQNMFNTLKADFSLLFKHSALLGKKELKKKKRVRNRIIGYTLVTIQIILACVFLLMLFNLNVVPTKYMIVLVTVLFLITLYNFASQLTNAHIFGKTIAFVMSAVLFTGSFYVSKTSGMLNSVVTDTVQTEKCSIIVLNTDTATSLSDTKKYSYGYHNTADKTSSEKVISQINSDHNITLDTTSYSSWELLINSLYNQTVKAIVINESYRSIIESEFADFNEKTRILDTFNIQTTLANTSNINVSEEPFAIYIAGNDSTDPLENDGRNDVNIIATFNPKTRQVMLITTPRDYYINIYKANYNFGTDKLTHAGSSGLNCSMDTLENLYGIDIDYFVKVNFTGTVNIVDALGGINVNSEVDFFTTPDTAPIKYHFMVGNNECDGEKALAFCRERQAFLIGDNQRGRNQMFAIQGIMAKASSTAIITNYVNVMKSVSSLFLTSMPEDKITLLIKAMLNDSTPWNIQSYNVTGLGGPGAPSHMYPNDSLLKNMSVQYPDYTSINKAISLMSMTRNGQIFDVNTYLGSQ